MTLSIIATLAKNHVIGLNNRLPWYPRVIPEDMGRFKKLTLGHTVVMGRKTYESIVKRRGGPLKDRKNVVLSRNQYFNPRGVEVERRFKDVAEKYGFGFEEEVFVIGGGEVYKQLIDHSDRMYLTRVHERFQGDTKFPRFSKSAWEEVYRDDRNGFSFVDYEREYWSA